MSSPSKHPSAFSGRRLELIHALLAREGSAPASGQIPRRATSGPAPVSFAQERLWFFARMAPESPVFNIPALFRITGRLDRARLEASLAEVIRRQDVLRSTFEVDRGRVVQVVAPAATARIEFVDLEELAPASREPEALRQARVAARRPFDLAHGPLHRLLLWRLDSEDHRLLVCLHHAISEVQSIGVLLRQLAAAYGEALDGQPQLPIQFADFAAWQRAAMRGERYERELAWWKEKLSGLTPLDLPTDRPRPAVQSFAGSTRTRRIPEELVLRLRELSREEGVTPFMVWLAGYAALLARTAQQDDLAIGAPMTDRDRVEIQDLIGFFVSTLVLRCNLAGDPSFRELLRRTRDVSLEAHEHRDVPFESLVEALRPERDLSRSPLFQVALLLQNESEQGEARLALGGDLLCQPWGDPLLVHTDTSKFDLSLIVWDRPQRTALSFEYSSDLYDSRTIDRMLARLEALLSAALADPDRPIGSLPLLGSEERRILLEDWNATEVPFLSGTCAHELFEAQADRSPDRVAVVDGERSLTYRELELRANRVAQRLVELGVGPGTLVGICTERCLEMVVGILGVLKAGGAYVPLDLAYPRDRLAFMLQDANAQVVLTRPDRVSFLPDSRARTLVLDEALLAGQRRLAQRLEPRATARDLAYVIYTSGSTGKPKGVELEHRGLVNLLTWHQRAYRVAPEDRATHLAGLAFDASVWELWPYLTAGSSLYLVPDEVRLSPPRLLAWLAEKRITQSFLPTPLAEAVLKEALPPTLELKWVFTGGDKLHAPPPPGLPFKLVNHYGPTENTVVATAVEVPPQESEVPSPPAPPPPPIGRPISNVRSYVVDRRGEPMPIGVPGELWIGGASLARGYRGRPDLDAEKFVPDRFSNATGARLYKTGDRVRWRADGELEFLGRSDAQVKIRGFRVELGEIEAVLGRHPSVAECAVALRASGVSGGKLIACFVPRSSASVSAAELRAHLARELPDYMVPSALVALDALPLTPNGKVDRSALPEPSEPEELFVPPQGALEQEIAGAWMDVLQLERVGANTNFFELGGHSLLLAQVHLRLQADLAPDLSIIELFQYPTVRSLAAHLQNGDDDAGLRESRGRAAERRSRLRQRRFSQEPSTGAERSSASG